MAKIHFFLSICLPIAAFSSIAMAAEPADGPTPFPDPKNEAAWPGKGPIRLFPSWMVPNRKSYWSLREHDQGAVVFVGDSNVQNWKAGQMAELLPKMKIANRGIGGDVSRGVLFRFQEDVMSLHPKVVVVLVGCNDLTAYGAPADAIENIAAIVAMAHKQDPSLPIVLCTVAPSANPKAPMKPGAREDLNDRIRKLGKSTAHVEVLDLFALLAGPDGMPVPENFGPDKLHFAGPGYVKWAGALRPILDKLIGSAGSVTTAGAALPSGWGLKIADRFGTGTASTVGTMTQLHAKYYEGQFYNRDKNDLVRIPNVRINGEQAAFVHFENSIVFATDHLTIQGRGHPDGSITSGELVSKFAARSWCVEARYRIPSQDKSWPAFWTYAATAGNDSSEVDFEQPITPNQGVNDVSMFNHPDAAIVEISDPLFTSKAMNWHNAAFDASAAPHYYTACYDDATGTLTRFIDGKKIYTAAFKWNASLGGAGHGPDACTIFNLAAGGSWPGNLTNPSAYNADLDLYSIEYYGPMETNSAAAPTSNKAADR